MSDGTAEETGQDHVLSAKLSLEPELENFSLSAEIETDDFIIIVTDSELEMAHILGCEVSFDSAQNLNKLISWRP